MSNAMRRLFLLLCLACLWSAPETWSAADPRSAPVQSGQRPGVVASVRPCETGSADLAEATLQLEALDALIRNLRPADDPKSANDALAALVGHHCMALAMSDLDAGSLRAERAVALVDFWRSGGETWIRSRLEQAATPVAAFPPPMRKVVAKETRNGQLVDELLCPLADTNCGSESAGWWLRAEARFRDLAVQVGPGFKPRPPDNGNMIPTDLLQPRFPTEKECRDQALEQPVAGRYAFWDLCVRANRKVGFVMPLGSLRAPTSGWLIVLGVRGHYGACSEIRMYSLASGAAFVRQDCNRLVQLGERDRAGPDAPLVPNPRMASGFMATDNLRELAWMLLLQGESVEGYVKSDVYGMPPGIDPVSGVVQGDRARDMGRKPRIVSSGSTVLDWVLVDAHGEGLASGALQWPGDVLGGPGGHAAELLRIAEAGFASGCPKEKPPGRFNVASTRPVIVPPGIAPEHDPRQTLLKEQDTLAGLGKAARQACRNGSDPIIAL